MTYTGNISELGQSRNTKLTTSAETLDGIAKRAILSGMADEDSPLTDLQRVLSRVCSGRGKPVPLYRIQHDPHGRGFMADPRTRKSELCKQWGFDIRQQYASGDRERSEWWIVCGPDGLPKIDRTAPKRGGKLEPKPEQPKPVQAERQPNLFHTLADVRAFCSYETGSAK